MRRATAKPERGQHRAMGAGERDYREYQPEASTLAAHFVPELGAARADLEMVLEGAAVQGAAAERGQLLSDVRALRVPCLGPMGKRRPCLIDECLHLLRCASDRLGDLRLIQGPQFEEQQSHPLILRQAPQIAE
jgi:hypothetical protein